MANLKIPTEEQIKKWFYDGEPFASIIEYLGIDLNNNMEACLAGDWLLNAIEDDWKISRNTIEAIQELVKAYNEYN